MATTFFFNPAKKRDFSTPFVTSVWVQRMFLFDLLYAHIWCCFRLLGAVFLLIRFLLVKSFLITSNKLIQGLPLLPSIKLSAFIANNVDKYAGESSWPLRMCPNILQRNLDTLTDKGVTSERAYNASFKMTPLGHLMLRILLRCLRWAMSSSFRDVKFIQWSLWCCPGVAVVNMDTTCASYIFIFLCSDLRIIWRYHRFNEQQYLIVGY